MDKRIKRVVHLREQGYTWKRIFAIVWEDFPECSESQFVQKYSDWYRRTYKPSAFEPVQTSIPLPPTTNSWKNGIMESDRLIEICETEKITPELMLKLHNLDPNEWEVTSYINNMWHGQKKGGSRIIQYQSKLFAKPITDRVTFKDVESYFEGKVFPHASLPEPMQYDPNGQTLEIDVADLHSGLLSWGRETGENYDVRIAKKRFMSVIDDNINRCKERGFQKVILALLGDLLHVDNDLQTTTKGTFQQADGRIAKIFESTLDMLIEAIQKLSLIAPVDVVYTSGNHDGTSGWMLIKALQMAFDHDSTVFIDVSPDPQKTRVIGRTMVGFVHGDMPEKNLSGWLQVQARQTPKSLKFLEVHTGHRHSQKVRERVQTHENEGVVERTMPTLCSASTWEHREGYAGAVCTSVSFVWHDQMGLREMWYSNV